MLRCFQVQLCPQRSAPSISLSNYALFLDLPYIQRPLFILPYNQRPLFILPYNQRPVFQFTLQSAPCLSIYLTISPLYFTYLTFSAIYIKFYITFSTLYLIKILQIHRSLFNLHNNQRPLFKFTLHSAPSISILRIAVSVSRISRISLNLIESTPSPISCFQKLQFRIGKNMFFLQLRIQIHHAYIYTLGFPIGIPLRGSKIPLCWKA